MPKLISIIINSSYPDLMVKFYGILGFSFERTEVRLGGHFFRACNKEVELTIYPCDKKHHLKIRSLQLAFHIKDMNEVIEKMKHQLELDPIAHFETENIGIRTIFVDPDGHSVELIQTEEDLIESEKDAQSTQKFAV